MKNKKTKKTETAKPKKIKRSDYDSAWKTVIKTFFKDFLEIFFPKIYKAIDFRRPPVFLDKELMDIAPGGSQGHKICDVLAKAKLKNGQYQYISIVIHIEIQGHQQQQFMKRMFLYFCRIFDREAKDNIPVISLAVLTDDNENFRPNAFEYGGDFGFEVRMKIPVVKIIDFRTDPELKKKLEKSNNPLSLVIQAQLKSLELKHAPDVQKYEVTKELIRLCYQAGYDKGTRFCILHFLAWVIKVSEDYKNGLRDLILEREEVSKVDFIPFFLEDTVRDRELKSERKGKREGIIESSKETAKRMLNDNFSLDQISKYTGLPKNQIKKLASQSA